MFPSSSHKFHTDCLMDEVMPHLSAARKRKVEEIQTELATSKAIHDDLQSVDSSKAVKVSRVDQVRFNPVIAKLVNLLATKNVWQRSSELTKVQIDLFNFM